MPTNLTLKGVPDEVYERLKTSAGINHRSLNSEIIARAGSADPALAVCRRATGGHPGHQRAAYPYHLRSRRDRPGQAPGTGVIDVDVNVLAYLLIPGKFTASVGKAAARPTTASTWPWRSFWIRRW